MWRPESGKRSADRLLQTQGANAARSQYRSAKQMELKNCRPANSHSDPCHYCGKHGHGKHPPIRVRKSECPAYRKTCDHCGRANHFAAVCQAKSQPGKRQPTLPSGASADAEGAIFDTLCTATTSSRDQSASAISLDHHLYNHLNDYWVRKTLQPQPFLTLTATIHPDDYTALRFKPVSQQSKSVRLSAMADTGCQSCLASITVIRRLGLTENDFIPVTTHMHAANNNGIKILGAIILRFSGESTSGQTFKTRQIVYVTHNSDKLFLSRETCKDLGMISGSFPTVGETPQPSTKNEPNMSSDAAGQTHQPSLPNVPDSARNPPCNCPRRVTPPPKPLSHLDHRPLTPATEPPQPKPNSSPPTPVVSNGNPSVIEEQAPTEVSEPLDLPMANPPPHQAIGRATTTAQEPRRDKLPLAMRRLMDHNKKGLLEQ